MYYFTLNQTSSSIFYKIKIYELHKRTWYHWSKWYLIDNCTYLSSDFDGRDAKDIAAFQLKNYLQRYNDLDHIDKQLAKYHNKTVIKPV